jgi:ethanolamine utilization protein EutA (predicted chaperonin)
MKDEIVAMAGFDLRQQIQGRGAGCDSRSSTPDRGAASVANSLSH